MNAGINKVLVTGAGGWVGGFVVDEALRHGALVRALVRDPDQGAELAARGAEVLVGDLRDGDVPGKAVEGMDGVYHIAALFRQAGAPDSAYRQVNCEAVRRLFDAAVAAGVRRVIHCSTGGVLGDVREIPANEQTPHNPGDVYQETKLAGEEAAMAAFARGKISGVAIRPGMIYGPGDTRNLKIFRMIARRRFFYVGKGDNLVHFVDVRDLARAFRLAMERQHLNGKIYLIAGHPHMPLRQFAAMVARQLEVPPPRICLPVKPMQWAGSLCEALCRPFGIPPPLYRRRVDFFTKNRAFDTSLAQRELGFSPGQPMEKEIADIIADYRRRGWL